MKLAIIDLEAQGVHALLDIVDTYGVFSDVSLFEWKHFEPPLLVL